MVHRAIPVTLLALTAPAAAIDRDADRARVEYAQVTIHERIIIRVPRVAPARSPAPSPASISRLAPAAPPPVTEWKEKKGPKCIAPGDVGGAIFGRSEQVDLMMIGGRRLRAKLAGDCGPMDFYSGVYIRPGSDGKICADRDVIRTRSGATCPIEGFRTLVAKR